MSKRNYHSVRYVGQEFHESLKSLFKKKAGGEIPIQHTDTIHDESIISYSIDRMKTRITISKESEGFYWICEVGFKKSTDEGGNEIFEEGGEKTLMPLKRTKEGKLSKPCLDRLAQQSLRQLKSFNRKRSLDSE